MRSNATAGLILIILGVLMLSVHSFTYFSHDQVAGPLGYFAWDVSQPRTIFVNPIAGLVAVGVGIALMVTARRRSIT